MCSVCPDDRANPITPDLGRAGRSHPAGASAGMRRANPTSGVEIAANGLGGSAVGGSNQGGRRLAGRRPVDGREDRDDLPGREPARSIGRGVTPDRATGRVAATERSQSDRLRAASVGFERRMGRDRGRRGPSAPNKANPARPAGRGEPGHPRVEGPSRRTKPTTKASGGGTSTERTQFHDIGLFPRGRVGCPTERTQFRSRDGVGPGRWAGGDGGSPSRGGRRTIMEEARGGMRLRRSPAETATR